ncbi:NAD(P)H:quinone oxidoreductase, type IV [candidate division LCP-89 bacterium B3_LCP]|uniref:NAD(P)H:quinone oxidoreductase, type IV n=1 Tax=candidate division LCP-89 bacterium B3_LCP TaxID=2012998 RepID=A0A532UU88_UNCL8|nr:MAG: NAD(P)H:quinone oxidoreductase, type IV [candidate division LCP-89 bacterium B3_LCP]
MKILVLYYSATGNIFKMAQAVTKGITEVPGVVGNLRRVPETLPQEEIRSNPAMKATAELQRDVSIVSKKDLIKCDGLVLGTPTRFGNMCAQMKAFIDSTGDLWSKGTLVDKPAGVFCSSNSLHGGQESTLLATYLPLLHHGMLIVGLPFSLPELMKADLGGSPYGATTVVRTSEGQGPTENDLAIARALGRRVATFTAKLRG